MGNAVEIKALFFSRIRGSPGAEIVFLNQDLAICARSVFRDFYVHLWVRSRVASSTSYMRREIVCVPAP
jgi:hypothetical protein